MLCVGQQLAYCEYLVALFHCFVFCRQCVFYEQINDGDDDISFNSRRLFDL